MFGKRRDGGFDDLTGRIGPLHFPSSTLCYAWDVCWEVFSSTSCATWCWMEPWSLEYLGGASNSKSVVEFVDWGENQLDAHGLGPVLQLQTLGELVFGCVCCNSAISAVLMGNLYPRCTLCTFYTVIASLFVRDIQILSDLPLKVWSDGGSSLSFLTRSPT